MHVREVIFAGRCACVDAKRPICVHRSKIGSPKIAEGGIDPGGAPSTDSNGRPDQLRKQSLVIEDYYCVSVEPADAQAPASLLAEVLDGVSGTKSGVSNPLPGQDSSVFSESEGPAQWLAAPKVGLDHGESLSMESADDTSESGSE